MKSNKLHLSAESLADFYDQCRRHGYQARQTNQDRDQAWVRFITAIRSSMDRLNLTIQHSQHGFYLFSQAYVKASRPRPTVVVTTLPPQFYWRRSSRGFTQAPDQWIREFAKSHEITIRDARHTLVSHYRQFDRTASYKTIAERNSK